MIGGGGGGGVVGKEGMRLSLSLSFSLSPPPGSLTWTVLLMATFT